MSSDNDRKIRVVSDRFNKFKEEHGNMLMGMNDEIIPVDMYGKRITLEKSDPDNLKNIGQDIKEYYDLEGDAGLS